MASAVVSLRAVRRALADYIAAEGCSCCRDLEGHKRAEARLARLLLVPRYDDDSGFDFYRFRTARKKAVSRAR